jgi:hypothetical protein
MKFTTPCFVRVEDAVERRELIMWLVKIGYVDRTNITYNEAVRWFEVHDPEPWISAVGIFISVVCPLPTGNYSNRKQIDCGTNIALFKALAAMNDENDYMQLFINKSNRYRWVFCNAQRLFDAVAKECDWRKATAAEIVEHFKK